MEPPARLPTVQPGEIGANRRGARVEVVARPVGSKEKRGPLLAPVSVLCLMVSTRLADPPSIAKLLLKAPLCEPHLPLGGKMVASKRIAKAYMSDTDA